ncbi:MAG: hypothetical protein U1A78_15930 [Polyangia bacterium]
MVRSAQVPPQFEPPFAKAESFVERHFNTLERQPEKGIVRVGGDRYVLLRAESLYLALFDALESSFGGEAASEFIYNTARIGKS